MTVRWSEEAASDLEHITDYLFEHAPARAAELVRAIYSAPAKLQNFPNRGRLGRKPRTRELVLTPLPYVIVYEVRADAVCVLRILHGAQQWP
jgi:toxin ParE1/3/4